MWFQYFLYNGGGGKVWKPVFVIVLKFPWHIGAQVVAVFTTNIYQIFL